MTSAVRSTDALAYERVLFVIPPTGAYCREDRCQSYFRFELIPSMRPPLEECESAGAIRDAGGTPLLIDAPAEGLDDDATLDRAAALQPDLVVVVVTFGSLDDDLAWATRLRERLPGTTIAVRGAPCYVAAEKILSDTPAVDFCVRGEYELVFADVVRRGYHDAVGTVFRDGARIVEPRRSPVVSDLDDLPRPDRSVIESGRYRVRGLGAPQATVRVQRGCPFPCTYCLVHTVSGNRARHRSPDDVAAEMAEVLRDGIRYFYLRAETFTLDRDWTLQTCAAIAERCPEARWVTTTRVECVDDEVLAAMRAGGCYGLSFGIDAASERIGEQVRKRPNRDRARSAMRLCDRHGIVSLGYFMLGFVWDDRDTLAETEQFIRDVRPDLLTIHFAHPYPGTVYASQVAERNLAIVSPHAQSEPALSLPGLTADDLSREAQRILRRHYVRPSVLQSLARKGVRIGFDRLWRPRHFDDPESIAESLASSRK